MLNKEIKNFNNDAGMRSDGDKSDGTVGGEWDGTGGSGNYQSMAQKHQCKTQRYDDGYVQA